MSYVQKILLPGEKVVGIGVLHWIMYLRGLSITIFGGLLAFSSHGLTTYLFGSNIADDYTKPVTIIAGVIVAYGVMMIMAGYIRQTATELVMTDHRLIAKYGIIARSTYEVMASRITGATFYQSVLGRLLGYGTVWIHGAGGEVTPITNVASPEIFQRAIVGVLERFQPVQRS